MADKIVPPTPEEIDQLRKDASEGDPHAAAFFRNNGDESAQRAALAEWRRGQITSSSEK